MIQSASPKKGFRAIPWRGVSVVAVLIGIIAWWKAGGAGGPEHPRSGPAARLVSGTTNILELSPEAADRFRISVEVARPTTEPIPLHLAGTLAIDPSLLTHVHSRFTGELVSLATTIEGGKHRPLRVGDRVEAGQMLAVVWSREIGEKKSDLVDGLSQLTLHQRIVERLKKLPSGDVALRTLEEAERNYEADLIAVARAERTLRSWRLTEEEIAAVHAEANRLSSGGTSDPASFKTWAEIVVHTPLSGVVMEKNAVPGDLVDTEIDLFKIADLQRLLVRANVFEEDLSKLERISPDRRRWQVTIKAEPEIAPQIGSFDVIGNIIDPGQHTASVLGRLDNLDGRLRVGQFVVATIDLPPESHEVTLNEGAVLDDGPKSFVFTIDENYPRRFAKREVRVVRRSGGKIVVAAEPNVSDGERNILPLMAGTRVVGRGVVELAGAMRLSSADDDRSPPEKEADAAERP